MLFDVIVRMTWLFVLSSRSFEFSPAFFHQRHAFTDTNSVTTLCALFNFIFLLDI